MSSYRAPPGTETNPNKPDIKICEMTEEMEEEVVNTVLLANIKYSSDQQLASFIKKTLDGKYSPNWHVFVGKSYFGDLIHEPGNFIYLKYRYRYYLIYKTV